MIPIYIIFMQDLKLKTMFADLRSELRNVERKFLVGSTLKIGDDEIPEV